MHTKTKNTKQTAIVNSRKKEANARRKLAKKWDLISKGIAYKRASVKESGRQATLLIEEELFDGTILDLKCCNENTPYMVKQRLLRRIVEKKQAQAVHRQLGRTEDRFSEFMKRHSFRHSLREISKFRKRA